MPPAPDADRLSIRELVENWALWRDAGDWERFATVWHPTQAWMSATWFAAPAPAFIAASRAGSPSPGRAKLTRRSPAGRRCVTHSGAMRSRTSPR